MPATRELEIEQNFRSFQHIVDNLLPNELGKFALMRHGKMEQLFPDLLDAIAAGQSRFTDGMFSIQEVRSQPLDLGFYSHANPSGPIC